MDIEEFKSVFSWKKYILRYPDLRRLRRDNAWGHANQYGWKENRIMFDDKDVNDWFIAFKRNGMSRPEIKETDPIEEFKYVFSWKKYLSRYPDLRRLSISGAWNHANQYGWKEDRIIFDDKDVNDRFIAFKKNNGIPKPEVGKYNNLNNQEITNTYIIIPNNNSIEHNIALNIGYNIEKNVNYILNTEIKNFTINESDLIIFMSSSHLIDMSIKCNKIAWLYKWDENWIKSLNKFDYVLTGTNKMKLFIETKYNVKCYNFSIGCNLCKTFNKDKPHYDVLFDVHEYNKYIDYIINFIKDNNDKKIKIIGNEWLKLVTSKTDKEFLSKYYSDVCINNDLNEIYKNSKIIVDLSDEKYLKYGCASNKITRAISNKKVIITNNDESSKEIFQNKLVTFSSYEEMITNIRNYLNDNNKYTTNVNNLFNYGKLLLDNRKMVNSLTCIKLFQKNKIKNDIIIKICGRGQPNFTFSDCALWGDLYMANNISRQLESKYGIICQICLLNDWYNYDMYNCNNVLFLRGISIYNPRPKNNNMVLFISHPETYTDKEFKKYNKIICCSKIFCEKIKNNLKLSDDDIIYALQPIDIPNNIETETKIMYDAVFIGNKIRERESVLWLTRDNLNKVRIFGDKWQDKHVNPIINNIKSINNDNVFDIYSKSKIILNDTWKDMREKGFISNRVLEGSITNNNIITDDVYGLNNFGLENIFIFKNKTELNQLFEKLVKKPKTTYNSKNKDIIINNNNKIINFIYKFLNFNIKNSSSTSSYYNFTLNQYNIFNKKLNHIRENKIQYKIIPKFKFNESPIIKNAKVFTMVKNEMDIIPYFIKYYSYLFGINNIHIIDNNSNDKTYDFLKNIKKEYDKFHLLQTPEDFNFINKKKMLSKQVNKYKNDCKYIFILDVDEFIFSLDNNITKQFRIMDTKTSDDLVVRMPDYLCYNYKNNFIENNEFIDDDKLCLRNNYAKCIFTNKSFNDLKDNGNHNFDIKDYLITDLRILHFHTRSRERTIHKKINLLTSYYGNFDIEKLNKLVPGNNARHVAKELLDYIINKNNLKYSKDLHIINIDVLRKFFSNK